MPSHPFIPIHDSDTMAVMWVRTEKVNTVTRHASHQRKRDSHKWHLNDRTHNSRQQGHPHQGKQKAATPTPATHPQPTHPPIHFTHMKGREKTATRARGWTHARTGCGFYFPKIPHTCPLPFHELKLTTKTHIHLLPYTRIPVCSQPRLFILFSSYLFPSFHSLPTIIYSPHISECSTLIHRTLST